MEEFRDLALEEWNFRQVVHNHLSGLLEQQRIYWKQRGIIKWAQLGDENTKKIHDNATIKLSKNTIRGLQDTNGIMKFKHEDKADILWEASKDRLG
jgi:hypothetical protein